ncbi:hypothetical protein BDZ88DRAFT_452708 [Geranomyces variabilis]|nr:hypothetical protein BDZ88DRAFT_452708 [Geranomyces variabilis]KAJ3140152.1 hypothetical protein HDU90_008376 [Geranomyces variabilis]
MALFCLDAAVPYPADCGRRGAEAARPRNCCGKDSCSGLPLGGTLAESGYAEVVALFLSHPPMTARLQQGCGVVIDAAARHGHLECMKLLAETTDLDATLALQSAVECVSPSYGPSAFDTARYDPFSSTDTWCCRDRGGDRTTGLVSALQFGRSKEQEVVELLLSSGANMPSSHQTSHQQ